MPGKSLSRCPAITSSSGTNLWRETSMNLGNDGGTLTRANSSFPAPGFLTTTAKLRDRPEMYGNGCDGSTARGVSTGKTCSSNKADIASRSSVVNSSQRKISIPLATNAGSIESLKVCDACFMAA